MMENQYVFQISGIKNVQLKGDLLRDIKRLRGKYIGGSKYKEEMTHLIVINPIASEKFIAASAAGKWIVTPEYVRNSAKSRAWLPEATYEINLPANLKSPGLTNLLLKWRTSVRSGVLTGAFQGWVVRLDIEDPARRGMLERILRAGKSVVCTEGSVSRGVTHVFTKTAVRPSVTPHHYSISYIAEHLFGTACASLGRPVDMNRQRHTVSSTKTHMAPSSSEETEDESTDAAVDLLLMELEETLKAYITKVELQKSPLDAPELLHCYTPVFPTQVTAMDFSNVHSLVECGLFPQALEEVQCSLQPGLLPPASVVRACIQHALQGEAQPYFLSMFVSVLNAILCNNPTWGNRRTVTYFLQVLQCPQCKNSAWSLLQTSVRFCLASTDTCHSLPSPAPPEVFRFHSNLQAFFLRLFQLELHAARTHGRSGGSRASVLGSAFWNVWERSTLSSRPVQQLTQLLVEASVWAFHSTQEWSLRVLATLQQILAVVVEFWAQENRQLSGPLLEKGFQDLAEHMAILCQDLHLDCLRTLVPALSSPRLRMFTAEAVYRDISCRKGLPLRPEPLTLLKIVTSYLKALGHLCASTPKQGLEAGPERNSDDRALGVEERQRVGVSGFGKENLPRGFHRVNRSGETLLHRACMKNQVETVLHILSVPGVDVNVKDHAGWTPLHEACNHGSSECVRALLQHSRDLQLDSQVEGVSPLHDALLNQHTHIARMLLKHAGSALLQVRDSYNRTPLDLVPSAELREEIRGWGREGDSLAAVEEEEEEEEDEQSTEVRDLTLVESCSCLLSCLLLSYLDEHHVPSYEASDPPLDLSPSKAQALASSSPGLLASLWGNPAVVSLAEDLRTLMNMERYVREAGPALTQCQGPHTSLFLHLLKALQDEGTALLRSSLNTHCC